MSAIGTVSQLIGRAIAVKADGSERVLSIGDEVQADELIRVSPDGSLEIKMESGEPVNLEGGQSWLATADTFQESDDFDTTEAIADVQSIQEAILAGADPTEVAEETAAGGEGEADGNEGSSFVQVEATREEVDPTAGYETVGIFDAPSELPSELQILLAPASKVTLEGSVVNEGDGTATITATVDNAPLTDLTITLSTGDTITILTGQTSGSTEVEINNEDDIYLDGEEFPVSILTTDGGNYESLDTSDTASVVILDTIDTINISLSATPSLSEGDATGIEYTVTLSGGVANNDITVTLDNGEVIVIPAGDPSASTFTAVQGDDVYLDGETVTNSIVSAAEANAGTPGALEDLTYDGSAVETVISDTEDTVTVSLSATPSLSEGDATGIEYTVTLSGGVANNDITVTLDNGEVIVIPAGDPSASTFTAVQGDDVYLDGETVTNSIVSAAEANAGTPGALEDLTYDGSAVETVISDTEDTVTATLTTSTSEIAETGGSITYTVTLSGTPGSIDPDADLVFTLTNPDGSGDPIQVTVSAGAVSGQVVVTYSDSEITTQTSIDNSIASFTGGSEYEELVTAGSTSVVVDYAPVITDLTPEAQGGDVVVDEDDLPNGSDGSDSVTQAGTFTIAAADGVETLTVGSLNVIQNGTYQGDGINIITPEGHTFTISGYDASTGIVSYTYTLNENESHDSAQGENSFFESLSVYLEDSDGDSTTGTLSAQIVDDVPSATPATNSGQITQAVDTNLMLVLDVSGSMNNQSSFQGMTRLEVMVKAGLELLDRYDAYGDVKVNVISFSSEGNDLSGGWVTVSEAKAILLELNAGGTTNYVDALNDLIASYNSNSSGMIADAQKISYFMSDGNPNVGGTVDQAAWESYVTDNGFLSYALGMGSGVNELNLEPIAYDGRGDGRTGSGSDIDVTVVTDLSELEAVLVSTVEVPPLSGLLLNGGVPGVVGADGGWVQSVTVDGVIYSYDAATDSSTVSGGTSNGAFNDDLNEWLITTVEGASLKVYMDTGMYEYLPPDDLVTEMQEVFGYTITDSDGDTASSTLTLSVDPLEGPMVVRDDFVITNQDTIEIPDWTLLVNDSGPDSDAQTLTAVDNSVSGAVTDNANNTVTFVDTGTQGGHFSYTNTAGGSSSDGQVSVNQVSGNILEGGYLDEIIIGGTDSEKLIGGAGDDSLFGGDGASSSVYRSIIADVKAGDTYSSDNNQFGFTFAQGTGLFITKISIDITGSGFFDQIGSGSKAFQIGDESDIDLFDITTVTSGDSTVLEIEFAPNAFVEGNTIRFGIDTDTGFNTGDEFGTNDIPFEVTFSDSISVNGIYEPGAGNSSVGTANNLYDDTLEGGQGNDILTGGEGDDIFVWSGSDADGGTDHVTDFAFDLADSNAENDVLDLSDLLSDGSNQLIAAEVDGHMQLTVANASDISDVKQVSSLDNINVANDSAADLLKDQLLTNGNIDDGIS
ncbi:MAG: retention module-containing protein [Neptuniibacter sp.]